MFSGNKILNYRSGRMVQKDGSVGKKILKEDPHYAEYVNLSSVKGKPLSKIPSKRRVIMCSGDLKRKGQWKDTLTVDVFNHPNVKLNLDLSEKPLPRKYENKFDYILTEYCGHGLYTVTKGNKFG